MVVLNSASPSRCESKETQDLPADMSWVAAFVHLEHPVSSQDAKEDELTEEEAGGWAFAGVYCEHTTESLRGIK